MTEAETFDCPNCGAPLTADGSSSTVRCAFCGASVIVPESLRPKPAVAVPQATGLPSTGAYSIPQPALRPSAGRTGSRSGMSLGCGIIVVAILAMAALGFLSQLFSGNKSSSLSQASGLIATPTVPLIQRPLDASLPRQVSYGGMVYKLTQGVIDNQKTMNEEKVNVKDQAFARLQVTLQNTTKENLYLDSSTIKLHLSDGKDYPIDSSSILDNSFTAPGPQSTGGTTFVFQVPPDAQWTGSSLVISAPQAEPAMIPLSGDLPKPAYPVQVSLPAQPEASAQGLTYQLLSASMDLDSGSQRADKGKRFLKIDLRVTNPTSKYGANVSSSNFRLLADGISYEPKEAPIEVVDYNASIEGQVVFPISDQTNSAVLQVGNVTADNPEFGKLTLDLTNTAPLATTAP